MSYWDDIVAFYRTVPELNDWLTDEEAKGLETIRSETMQLWQEVILYQGFDVVRIIRRARAAYSDYMSTTTRESSTSSVVINGKQVDFTYSNMEPMHKDLQFLFFLFANRGCSYDKIVDKSNHETQVILEWLVTKFQLDTTVHQSGKSLPPDLITIPRLTACFPTITCLIFDANQAKEIVKPSDIGLPVGVSHAVLCPLLVSAIPPEMISVGQNVHMVTFCVHVLLDDVLHRRDGKPTGLEEILSYYKAAYNSVAVPRSARLKFMTKLRLSVVGQNVFIPDLLNLVGPSEGIIRASRSADPKLESVLAEVKALKALG